MRIGKWSVLETPDGKGLTIMNLGDNCFAEVCLSLEGEMFEVRSYEPGVDEPVFVESFNAFKDFE